MTPELNAETKAFWSLVSSKKREYPFWVRTSTVSPRPELMPKRYYHFIRIPHGEYAYWGFKEHDKRNEFQRRYDAMPWSAA